MLYKRGVKYYTTKHIADIPSSSVGARYIMDVSSMYNSIFYDLIVRSFTFN